MLYIKDITMAVIRRNASRRLYILGELLILKNFEAGNFRQRKLQPNDWCMGKINGITLAGWSKYLGGDQIDETNYDITDSVDPSAFANI